MTDEASTTGEALDLESEEDLKARVVLPVLAAFGVTADELKCERTFTVHVGKQACPIDGRDPSGRLDILVQRRGRNLCVLELKRTGVKITEADYRQAASYARLVEPNVAPLCVVTNGRDTHLVDALTRLRLSEADARTIIDGDLAPSLPEDLRREALRIFIGLSRANLSSVCAAQVRARTACVRQVGGTEIWKQYVPELYARPRVVDAKLREFRQSPARVLLLEGPSGVGKTSATVHIADQLVAEGEAAFFFLARDVTAGIFEAIGEELSWSLSGQGTTSQAVRNMIDAVSSAHVFVLVDNLDELPSTTAIRVLDAFLHHAPASVKLVTTCTARSLAGLLQRDSVATAFADEIRTLGGSFRVELAELDEATFLDIVSKYERHYRLARPLSPALLAQARRDPLLLRLACEAIAETGEESAYDVQAFYHAYFDRQLGQDDADAPRRFLKEIAQVLVKADTEQVSEDTLRAELRLPVSEDIPEVLFRKNILVRIPGSAVPRVGFTYSRMRDFVYSVWVRGWSALSADEFRRQVEPMLAAAVSTAPVASYYRFAAPEHRRVLDEPAHGNARRFLDEYVALRRGHFPALRRQDTGAAPVGLVACLQLRSEGPRIGAYGFRALLPEEEPLVLLSSHTADFKGDEAFARGTSLLMWNSVTAGFGPACDPRALALHDLRRDVLEAIKTGAIDEAGCSTLLSERVVGRVAKLRGRNLHFPLRLREVLVSVVAKLIGDQLVWARVLSGEIPSTRRAQFVAYAHDPGVDETELESRASALLGDFGGWSLPVELLPYASADDVALARDLGALAASGHDSLDGPPILQPERRASPAVHVRAVARAYELFLQEYRAFLRLAFPTLQPHSEIVSRPGIRCFVGPNPRGRENGVKITLCIDASDAVVACDDGDLIDDVSLDRPVQYRGGKYPVFHQTFTSSDFILRPPSGFAGYDVDTRCCVVRALVYRQLKTDLERFLPTLT